VVPKGALVAPNDGVEDCPNGCTNGAEVGVFGNAEGVELGKDPNAWPKPGELLNEEDGMDVVPKLNPALSSAFAEAPKVKLEGTTVDEKLKPVDAVAGWLKSGVVDKEDGAG